MNRNSDVCQLVLSLALGAILLTGGVANGDGYVDFGDINPFIALLGGN